MTTSFDTIAMLSEQDLLDQFEALVVRDRRTTAELLVVIAEIDERKLWAAHACSSMFAFCMESFHMSEQVTAKRLWAARTARRFPVILQMVERGELHLGAIHLLARHLTADNHERVLQRARHKSSREVELLVAELAPRADVPPRIRAMPMRRAAGAQVDGSVQVDALRVEAMQLDGSMRSDGSGAALSSNEDPIPRDAPSWSGATTTSEAAGAIDRQPSRTAQPATTTKPIVPLSPRRYKIEITVDEATHDKLRSLQDLLGRSDTGRDPAAIISRAIDVLLDRTLTRKVGSSERLHPIAAKTQSTDRSGSTMPAADAAASQRRQRARTIPAGVRREVWRRDCGRCCFVDARGRRCGRTSNVEFHHRNPFAMGGRHTPENIELRCAAHNQYQADLDFGRSFMDRRRARIASDRTFPGECPATAAAS